MSIKKAMAFALASAFAGAASAEITFEDTSAATGVDITRFESWGASWGDFNSDGWPDVFTNNHRSPASLWQNNGDGTFTDVSNAVDLDEGWTFNAPLHLDDHGAAWGDVDNDGDVDLMLAGNQEWFFRNDFGNLRLASPSVGFDLVQGREGASAAWMDYNNDGALDMKISHTKRRGIFRQNPATGVFVELKDGAMQCDQGNQGYVQLANFNDSGLMEVICVDAELPMQGIAHEMNAAGGDFTVINGLPIAKPVRDSAVADFNGDGLVDLFGVMSTMRPSDAAMVGDNRIEAQLSVTGVGEKSFTFTTTGVVDFFVDWNRGGRLDVIIGAGETSPDVYRPVFTLDPADPTWHGFPVRDGGNDNDSMLIGYDPATNTWEVALRTVNRWSYAFIGIDSTASTTLGDVITEERGDLPMLPTFRLNSSSGLLANSASTAGFGEVQCIGTAAGDFDNDMDVDLYLTCRNGVTNAVNRLYENLGDGTFAEVAGAGGAAGPTGIAYGPDAEGVGTSDSAVVADYDADGYLDLFVTNGLNMRPTYHGGPNSMFRNTGTGNNWLQFDLQGVISNRDGIGAIVRVTTPDGTTQLREQNGGYHRWSQDFMRIHVGLAGNQSADVEVTWPSGTVDTFNDVAANGIYVLNEGGTAEAKEFKAVKPFKCSMPAIDNTADSGVFLWKRCGSPDDIWEVRFNSVVDPMTYDGGIFVASGAVENALEKNLETPDTLTTSNGDVLFSFETASTSYDGFTFEVPSPDTEACFDFRASQRIDIHVGNERRTYRGPFDLHTLEPCQALPNDASPVVSAVADQSSERNANVSVQVEATDADGDWPYFSADGLPPGIAIDENSGLITGASSQDGTYAVTVTADDGRGQAQSANFNWTITAPPPPPPRIEPSGGGGGSLGIWFAAFLLLSLAWRFSRRQVAQQPARKR